MTRSRVCLLWGMAALILVLAACTPGVTEPPAEAPSQAYPALVPATLPPYPWPTVTPQPTDPPDPTEEPTETLVPLPTLPPTPVVTPIPTAVPPIIPFPDGTTAQPFTLFWRDGEVILSLRSEGEAEPVVFLDPAKEFSLYLTPEEAYIRSWGTVSPDGRSLALVLTEEPNPISSIDVPYPTHIYVLDRESRELRLLVKYGIEPVWSPDGTRLAYLSTKTGGLRVVDADGEATSELYVPDRDHAHNVTAFTWSPDNRYIAVLDQVFYESTDLFIVETGEKQAEQLLIDSSSNWVYAPQWSPTSDQIAFLWGAGERGGGIQLRVVDLGGSQQQLAKGISAGGGAPRWSPDGQWIAYAGIAVYEPLPAQIDLWLVNSVEETLKRLTFDEKAGADTEDVQDTSPVWSPDGTQLVFRKGQEVWGVSLLDGSKRKLFSASSTHDFGLVITQ